MIPTVLYLSLAVSLCLGAPGKTEQKAGGKTDPLVAEAIKEINNHLSQYQGLNTGADQQKPQADQINCTLTDYFCNPTGADLIERVADRVIKSAKQCHDICKKQKDCEYFTFFKFRTHPSCYLLRTCEDKKPMCTVPGTCVSAEMKCQEDVPCPKLEFKKGAYARWICDGVNPYEENIPSHVTCHANCHSWTNAAGEMVTAKSTCQSDGTWSKPTAFPGGPLKNPAMLNSPDGPDMECGDCKPLNLTYNPNEEKGTEFYCNPRVDFSNLPVKIDHQAQCNLLCDKMLVLVVECQNANWTGRPDLGFWCSEKKPPVGLWEP